MILENLDNDERRRNSHQEINNNVLREVWKVCTKCKLEPHTKLFKRKGNTDEISVHIVNEQVQDSTWSCAGVCNMFLYWRAHIMLATLILAYLVFW